MSKNIYFKIFRFNVAGANVYLHEVIAKFFQQIIPLLFNIFLWSLVIKSNPDSENTVEELISYYLMAAGLGILLMTRFGRFGSSLKNIVKEGRLNQFLIKPYNELTAIYSQTLGQVYAMFLVAFIFVIAGLVIRISNLNLVSIIFFIWALINAFFINYAWNILDSGITSLLTTEASGIRSTINHFTSFLSGFTVPLFFFPEEVLRILQFTPFPHMLFNVIQGLTITEFSNELVLRYLIGSGWAIVLFFGINYLWKFLLKRYEGVGI